ncbi:MAG: PKD domain-containing protein, partial [Promethearchaeota archaeon]
IGDIPYQIPGGSNQDIFPLITSWENSAPETPTINGPSSGIIEDELSYTFFASDVDEHGLIYEINWGHDGDNGTELCYYDSGEDITLNHTWNEEGTFTISAIVKDIYGAESDWATFQVELPKAKTHIRSILLYFIKYLPNLAPILQRLIRFQ